MKGFLYEKLSAKIVMVFDEVISVDLHEPSVTFRSKDQGLCKIGEFDKKLIDLRVIKEDIPLKIGDSIPLGVTDATNEYIIESIDEKVLRIDNDTSSMILELASTQLSNADLMLELANVSMEKEELKSQLNDVQIELANVLLELATGGMQNV
ncbi:hypothetical protein [Cytobacillus praedii]|uniref:Uncharacterized protein n=1 Tax=Cytobacillus praedii TaxID=1742358 RepID=A0A4R1AYJ3_9BACI|nr:hypothetical protein [Cytobacillus praedii]TCJ05038.1 hypothetical protein E0Y62_07425 [Cytobacillus praedii]